MIKLLLDFDGVVLKNQKLMQYQYRRSARFVQKHTYLPLSKSDELNRTYFPKYGHTVIMLNELFDKKVTLEEYNEFVFPTSNIYALDSLIDKTTFEYGNDFAELFKTNLCDSYIFTNAHLNWVTVFAALFDIPLDSSKVIWPQSLDMLKPLPRAYDELNEKFKEADRIVFVDDSQKNLIYPKTLAKWDTMLFTHKDNAHTINQKLNV